MAGGAASIVGQKSKSKEYTYSIITEHRFVNDCRKDANENVCRCVFEKIKGQYSENEYMQIDYDLGKNKPHPEFVKFVTKASQECDASNLRTANHALESNRAETVNDYEDAEVISEAEAREYVDNFSKNIPKKVFVSDLSEMAKELWDEKQAKKIYGCAYDHIVNDKTRFTAYVMTNGLPEEESWGAEYIIECLPEKYPPNFTRNFINYLNKSGIPKSMAQCMVNAIKKEYTLKNLVAALFTQKEYTRALLGLTAAKCVDQ